MSRYVGAKIRWVLFGVLAICRGCGRQLSAPVARAPKALVFIGASITEFWASYVGFAGHHWIDKGMAARKALE